MHRRHPSLFVAMDSTDASMLDDLCNLARAQDVGIKIGMEAFYHFGAAKVISATRGVALFLDLKLHDIPNTVRKGLGSLVGQLSPSLITVHASGGMAMLQGAAEVQTASLDIAAVTLLTSLGPEDLSIFGASNSQDKVVELARLAARSGCRALVCSGHEVDAVKRAEPRLWTIVPGIRLAEDSPGDQRRVMTPRQAIMAGADSLVVGRSISGAPDPSVAVQQVLADIAAGLGERAG